MHTATLLCWGIPQEEGPAQRRWEAAYLSIPPRLGPLRLTLATWEESLWLLKGPCLVARGPSESLETRGCVLVTATIQKKEEGLGVFI